MEKIADEAMGAYNEWVSTDKSEDTMCEMIAQAIVNYLTEEK